MKRYPWTAATVLVAAGFGIALAQDDEPGEPDEITSIDANAGPPTAEAACFNVREARNFEAITDRYVYVEGRRDEHYLLTMFTGCIGLRGSLGIAISNRTTRVCSNSSGSITYRGLGRVESCTIRGVERVDSKEAAETIVEMRTRPQD